MQELRCMVSELSAQVKKKNHDNLVPFQKLGEAKIDAKSAEYNKKSYAMALQKLPAGLADSADAQPSTRQKQYAQDIGPNENSDNSSHMWTLIKQRKPSAKIGKLKTTTIKSVEKKMKPAEIFISRLDPLTTTEELTTFVKKQFPDSSVSCEQLATKYDTYSSFHVSIQNIAFKEIYNPNNWPSGILVKRFFFKSQDSSESLASTSSLT